MKASSSSKRFDFRTQIGKITSLLDEEKIAEDSEVPDDVEPTDRADHPVVGPSPAAIGETQGRGDGQASVEGIMGSEEEDLGFFESVQLPEEGPAQDSELADIASARLGDRDPVSIHAASRSIEVEISRDENGAGEHVEAPDDEVAESESIEEYAGPIDGHGNVIEIEEETTLSNGRRIADRVVQRLVRKELITEEQLNDSLDEWQRLRTEGYKVPLWRVVSLDPRVDRERIYREAADVYAFEEASISYREALAFVEAIAEQFEGPHLDRMIELFVIPVAQVAESRTGEVRWIFVTHDPTRPEVHRLLQDLRLRRFELRYTSESFISELITEGFLSKNEYLDRLNEDPLIYDLGTNFEEDSGLIDEEALEAEINRSSLINLFEATLIEAVKKGASDIHIFPTSEGQIEINFRVDGELTRWHLEERIHPEAFLAVVKDNSNNVDRFERYTAQDGSIQRRIADVVIRFRVSILPIAAHRPGMNAESIVIRVLDDRKVLTDLGKLGMLEDSMKRFDHAIRQPYGMVILTGPTGSGKSTTLVAALHQVVTPKVNVLTVEDPVEYLIRGVRQIKLNSRLDMEGALRSILRHDPDIVMVGEMRDRQTAELAIKLANTGHLTFSTLHTNDAVSAVSRLYKMGIEPFLIAYAINIVVAQRLIRKLCPKCKVESKNQDAELLGYLGFTGEEVESTTFYEATMGSDCHTCGGQGFKGRRAIAETLPFTNEIRKKILAAGEMIDEEGLRVQAQAEGMRSLRDSAKRIVMMGETSVEEMIRVTGTSE
jgi:type IV pilus assembly protein PilB